ncbi:MAG: 3-phosphoshikimate 1-carboxyvinyltransferase [Candidatus Omnitrophica bacterium]|nr:3-phosphoshikimate 1-carboxyvinyltransferase [Candidatus Omnitrophota bacterium]
MRIYGKISLPGDKSIAHRSIILSVISRGKTAIYNLPGNQDCLSTIRALRKLGASISKKKYNKVIISGQGIYGLTRPKMPVFIGESGTTFRLLLGVLAGQPFKVTLAAGSSLSRRPMRRVTEPLRKMGATINSKLKKSPPGAGPPTAEKIEEFPPITISGGALKGITYKMPVASAQVKSAILLAGLFAEGKTIVIEGVPTRDHTERMLRLFGAAVNPKGHRISLTGGRELKSPGKIYIPGDISSASFFIAGALILPGSHLIIKDISLNPTRMGIIKVLKRMGADIKLTKQAKGYEPVGDLVIKSSDLKATTVEKTEIPSLIDELPILMVASCFADGETRFCGVEELRVKETDRIKSMADNLRKMRANIKVIKSGKQVCISVKGGRGLKAAQVESFGDHRTAMSMVIAGLGATGKTKVSGLSCIAKSFPGFQSVLKSIIR